MCVGVPAQVVTIIDDRQALVDVAGVQRVIDASLVMSDGLAVGNWVLVHVGFAMSILDEEEARRQLDFIELMGGGDEELAAFRATGGDR